MTPDSLPHRDTFSARWWTDFFAADLAIQAEHVQEAIEATLALPLGCSDNLWGAAMDAHEQGAVYVVHDLFTSHHLVALSATYLLDCRDDGAITLTDVLGRHPDVRIRVEGRPPAELREMVRAADAERKATFPWIEGWRANAFTRGTGDDPIEPSAPGLN
jgi:hypothetical protein